MAALAMQYFLVTQRAVGISAEIVALAAFTAAVLLLSALLRVLRRLRSVRSATAVHPHEFDLFDLGNVSLRDSDDHIVRWSDGCRRLYGFNAREAKGRVCHELLQTRFPEPWPQIRRLLLERGCWEGELVHRHKNGAEVVVASSWRLQRPRKGRPALIVTVDNDLTQYRRAAERFALCEEQCRIITETTLQGVMEQDRDGKFVAVNTAAERILGRSSAELLGRSPLDQEWQMLREDRTPLPPHEHPGLLALRTGQRINEASLGVWNPRVQAYRWLSMAAVPLNLPGKSCGRGVYTLFTDVTDIQRADAAAQRAAERHATALDAAIMGTWDYHPASESLFWDPRCRSIFGVGFGDRIEFQAVLALVHEEDRPRVAAEFKRALDPASSGAYESEYRVVWPDGSAHWVNAIGQAYFKGGQRQAVRFIGTTLDITERKRLEEERDALLTSERAARTEAERANRLKDEFVATLSHELRNPLNVILGWVQILQRSKRTPGDVEEGIQIIHGSGRILADLISQLLDISRITSGKLLLDMQTIDLREVVTAALETARPAIDAKDIRLETVLDQAAGRAHGDPNRLKQVVWNLLSNAVKFTERGGLIRVETTRCDSRLEIRVSDTGQGIDPEFLPHVFERFRQEDASAARKHGGLGLGLSIARSLVEMHGGSIKVASAGRGRGATFTIDLPMLAHPAGNGQAAAGPAEAVGRQPDGHADIVLAGVRVLVVDDDRASLEIVKRVLEERRATVFTAANARQGLELLSRLRPDVLISDIGMPEEDGYRFLRRVRALDSDHGGGTPAMALTAFAAPEDQRRAMLCGYQAHLTKPIEASRLIAMVAGLAKQAGQRAPAGEPKTRST